MYIAHTLRVFGCYRKHGVFAVVTACARAVSLRSGGVKEPWAVDILCDFIGWENATQYIPTMDSPQPLTRAAGQPHPATTPQPIPFPVIPVIGIFYVRILYADAESAKRRLSVRKLAVQPNTTELENCGTMCGDRGVGEAWEG